MRKPFLYRLLVVRTQSLAPHGSVNTSPPPEDRGWSLAAEHTRHVYRKKLLLLL